MDMDRSMADSPRGWDSDPEMDLETCVRGHEKETTRRDSVMSPKSPGGESRARKGQEVGAREGLSVPVVEKQQDSRESVVERLEGTVRRLTFELSETKANEELLMRELRRLRKEYDNGIVQHEQSILTTSRNGDFTTWIKSLETPTNSDSDGQRANLNHPPDDHGENSKEKSNDETRSPCEPLFNDLKAAELKIEESLGSVHEREREVYRDKALIMLLRQELSRIKSVLNQTWKESQERMRAGNRDLEQTRSSLSLAEERLEYANAETRRQRKALETQFSKTQELMSDLERLRREFSREREASSESQEKAIAAEREKDATILRLEKEVEILKQQNDRLKTDLEGTKAKKKQEASRQGRDMYEQFIAYRDLWKKSTETAQAHSAFLRSLSLLVGVSSDQVKHVISSNEKEDNDGQEPTCPKNSIARNDPGALATSTSARQEATNAALRDLVLGKVGEMRNNLVNEMKHREAANRNFSICQKRLDRCLVKIQHLNQEISELQTAQREVQGLSIAEYERWWDEFRSMKRLNRPAKSKLATTASQEEKQNDLFQHPPAISATSICAPESANASFFQHRTITTTTSAIPNTEEDNSHRSTPRADNKDRHRRKQQDEQVKTLSLSGFSKLKGGGNPLGSAKLVGRTSSLDNGLAAKRIATGGYHWSSAGNAILTPKKGFSNGATTKLPGLK